MAVQRRVQTGHQIKSGEVVRIVLIGGGLIVLALVAWQLSEVLLLAFAAVVFGAVLRGFADQIQMRTHLPMPVSFGLACLLIAAAIAGFFYLVGVQIQSQLGGLAQQLPDLIHATGQRFGISNLETDVVDRITGTLKSGAGVGSLAGYAGGLFGVASSTLIVLVAGIYLGMSPEEYRRGVLHLVPHHSRELVSDALDNAGRALRLWLLGQLLVMLSIGVLTGLAMFVIGMPSALALGFIAGVLEFIPFIGPIMAAVPAVLIALTSNDPYLIYWVVGAYLIIQQLENNILVPIIQRQTVDLPPVLGLFALVAFGILFGVLGILLAIPLTVVLLVLVKHLYIREALEDEVTLPGEPVEEVVVAETATETTTLVTEKKPDAVV
jgi:predicted PurR-regulated permease PerM